MLCWHAQGPFYDGGGGIWENKGQYGLKPKFKAKGTYVDSNKWNLRSIEIH